MVTLYYILTAAAQFAFWGSIGEPWTGRMFVVRFIWAFLTIGLLGLWASNPSCPRPIVWLWKIVKWTFLIGGGALLLLGMTRSGNK